MEFLRKRSGASAAAFSVGTAVEVRMHDNDEGFRGAWYEATIIRVLPKGRGYKVLHASLVAAADPSQPLRETIPSSYIRPRPPSFAADDPYAPDELVDVFYNDGWWPGVVVAAYGGNPPSLYSVCFPLCRDEAAYSPSQMRPHLEWSSGQWAPSSLTGAMFVAGEEIEVDGDRENSDDYGTAWLTGTVMKVIDKTTYTVEYRKIQEDGSPDLLTEILDERYIRPVPPRTPKGKVFAVVEEIEFRHCGGWIVGVVLRVVDGLNYIVKVKYGKGEEMELNRRDMRIRHNWINGQWKCTNKCAKRVPTMKTHNTEESPSHSEEQSLPKHRMSEGSVSSMPEAQIPPNVQTDILPPGSITFRHGPLSPNVQTNIPSMPEAQVPSDVQREILSPGVPRHAPPSTQFEAPRANSCSKHMIARHGERSKEKVAKSIAIPNAQLSVCVQANIQSSESPVVPGNPVELVFSSSASPTTAPIARSSLINNHGQLSLATKALTPTSSSPGLKRKMGEGLCYEGQVEALRPCKQKKKGDSSEQPCLKIDHRTPVVEIELPDAAEGTANPPIELTMGNEAEKMAHQSDPAHTRNAVKRIPFVKSSFLWKSVESMEIFDIMPQDPCFRQLKELSEEIREGMAIGLMVTFANLASRVEKLCIYDSYATFKERLEALEPLEENGFDVRRLRSRIEELLEIKGYQRQFKNKKTALEEQMLEKESEESRLGTLNCALDKTIMEVERHLASLREERDSVYLQRMTSRLEMAKLQKDAEAAEEAYLSAERCFTTVLTSPW